MSSPRCRAMSVWALSRGRRDGRACATAFPSAATLLASRATSARSSRNSAWSAARCSSSARCSADGWITETGLPPPICATEEWVDPAEGGSGGPAGVGVVAGAVAAAVVIGKVGAAATEGAAASGAVLLEAVASCRSAGPAAVGRLGLVGSGIFAGDLADAIVVRSAPARSAITCSCEGTASSIPLACVGGAGDGTVDSAERGISAVGACVAWRVVSPPNEAANSSSTPQTTPNAGNRYRHTPDFLRAEPTRVQFATSDGSRPA